MQNIPKWVIVMMTKEGFKCPHCDKLFNAKNIMSLGIRHSVRDVNKQVLFIEYFCISCKKQTDLEFVEMTLAHLAQDIMADIEGEIADYIEKKIKKEDLSIEDMDQSEYDAIINEFYDLKDKEVSDEQGGRNLIPKETEKREKVVKKSKITLKDIKEARKELNKIESHEEFLLLLGMSQEQVDEYNIKKGK